LGTVDSEYINLAYGAKHHRQSRKKVIMKQGKTAFQSTTAKDLEKVVITRIRYASKKSTEHTGE
jgi:hypothetical protein